MRKSLVFIYFEYRSTHASYLPSQSTGTAKPGPFSFLFRPMRCAKGGYIYRLKRGDEGVYRQDRTFWGEEDWDLYLDAPAGRMR